MRQCEPKYMRSSSCERLLEMEIVINELLSKTTERFLKTLIGGGAVERRRHNDIKKSG